MLRSIAACAVLSLTCACSQPTAPAAPVEAPPPLTSGFDAATFDKTTRPQDEIGRASCRDRV